MGGNVTTEHLLGEMMQSGPLHKARTFLIAACAMFAPIAVLAGPPTSAPAATQPAKPVTFDKIISLTLHPAALPRPALRYRLFPDLLDQLPGNAAPTYLLAAELLPSTESQKQLWEKVDKWLDLPIG